jgi:uncharacterized protein YcgI (DUF1989 family)
MAATADAKDVRLPAGYGLLVVLPAEALLTVRQTAGHQVVDLIAFRSEDLSERLSTSHTIASLARRWPGVGQRYLSNRRTPLLEVVEDTVGAHDLVIAACDPWRYRYDFGVESHRSCSDNFLEAFGAYQLQRHELPNPVNLFQRMSYREDGSVQFELSPAQAGDYVRLRALVPLLVGLSACPMDLNPISGGRPSDIMVEVDG